jgi:hypothetical protein
MARHPAYRRYTRRMAGLGAAYVAAILVAATFIPDGSPPTPAAIALALVPGIAVLGVIWTMGRLLLELDDEYLRLLEVRKFIVATGLLLAFASLWGLLELFTAVPRVPVFYAFPVWCLGLGAGALYNRLTMGEDASCP